MFDFTNLDDIEENVVCSASMAVRHASPNPVCGALLLQRVGLPQDQAKDLSILQSNESSCGNMSMIE